MIRMSCATFVGTFLLLFGAVARPQTPLEFDHVITAVVRGEDPARWTWMDTTVEIAPMGMLPAGLRGRFSSDRRAPAVGWSRRREIRVDRALGVDQHRARVDARRGQHRAEQLLRGDRFRLDGWTLCVRPVPAIDATSSVRGDVDPIGVLRRLAEVHGLTGEITDVTTADPTDWRTPFELAFRYRSAGYLDWAAKSSGVAVIPRVDFPFATGADREKMPRLVLGSPYKVQLNTEIQLPPGYTIQPGVAVNTANAGFTIRPRTKPAAVFSLSGGSCPPRFAKFRRSDSRSTLL